MERIKYDVSVKHFFTDAEVDHSQYLNSFAEAVAWAERVLAKDKEYQATINALCFAETSIQWETFVAIGNQGDSGRFYWSHQHVQELKRREPKVRRVSLAMELATA